MKTLREMMDLIESAQSVDLRARAAEGKKDDSDMEIHQKNAARFGRNLGLSDRSSKKSKKETDMDQHRKNAERFGKTQKNKELEETEADPVRRIEELFRDRH